MQDGAMQDKKPSVIEENIRNLLQGAKTHKLWLIDNESGLLDAYEYIYSQVGSGKNFIKFHQDMLQTMCIFEEKVVTNVKKLAIDPTPHLTLEMYALQNEPLIKKFVKGRAYQVFTNRFSERLNEVQNWIDHCIDLTNKFR